MPRDSPPGFCPPFPGEPDGCWAPAWRHWEHWENWEHWEGTRPPPQLPVPPSLSPRHRLQDPHCGHRWQEDQAAGLGIVLVYDITDEKSFENIQNWMKSIKENASAGVERLLLGNKCDMEGRRKVQRDAAEKRQVQRERGGGLPHAGAGHPAQILPQSPPRQQQQGPAGARPPPEGRREMLPGVGARELPETPGAARAPLRRDLGGNLGGFGAAPLSPCAIKPRCALSRLRSLFDGGLEGRNGVGIAVGTGTGTGIAIGTGLEDGKDIDTGIGIGTGTGPGPGRAAAKPHPSHAHNTKLGLMPRPL
ncbi:uncharacterized protein LOC127060635 isoform X2 [Serinus canaria]|uniref:uncharacterized protein LOC127060635 isoform X2 n=1 Tax=Serinus canaria TaxID=9135 RepID=UPI0021CD0547|nr:uncharacterized protein LOC127060635 isoform X2 [Serinus canaria]